LTMKIASSNVGARPHSWKSNRRASNYIKKKGRIAGILAMVGDGGLEPPTFCV
jgi:hypothetical protein